MNRQDAYYKKEITFKFRRQALRFRVSQSLFSSYQIDVGTQFLLRTIASTNSDKFGKILYLGCGYGPIGLTLKQVNDDSVVHMVDRDALAVEYARQNAELNRLSCIKSYGSLGYDDVATADFDLIVSNIPAKAGELVISDFLGDAVHYLSPGGMVAVVVVTSLESTVAEMIENTASVNLLLRKTRPGHAVFHYQFSETDGEVSRTRQNALERGVYHRDSLTFSFHDLKYQICTAFGLPEFNSLSHHTELLMEGIQNLRNSAISRAVVFNPGQGHILVVLWKLIQPDHIALVGRDLLSLRYAKNNLLLNECPGGQITLSHQVGVLSKDQGQADLVVGVLREDEGTEAIALTVKQAAEQLSPDGTVLVSASSTAVTRLVGAVRSQRLLRIKERTRRKGTSLLVMERN